MVALAEWLRRVPAKYMGSPRESSNLSGDATGSNPFYSLHEAPIIRNYIHIHYKFHPHHLSQSSFMFYMVEPPLANTYFPHYANKMRHYFDTSSSSFLPCGCQWGSGINKKYHPLRGCRDIKNKMYNNLTIVINSTEVLGAKMILTSKFYAWSKAWVGNTR